jgi:hypothetical protein
LIENFVHLNRLNDLRSLSGFLASTVNASSLHLSTIWI